jgi:hypothetical protein
MAEESEASPKETWGRTVEREMKEKGWTWSIFQPTDRNGKL